MFKTTTHFAMDSYVTTGHLVVPPTNLNVSDGLILDSGYMSLLRLSSFEQFSQKRMLQINNCDIYFATTLTGPIRVTVSRIRDAACRAHVCEGSQIGSRMHGLLRIPQKMQQLLFPEDEKTRSYTLSAI
jgi:hypothetical protein